MTNEQKTAKKSGKVIFWVLLHLMLAAYSLGGVCSKFAAEAPFLSFRFFLFYGLLLVILALYALGWQQIIKRMPLTAAFANKAVCVIWGGIYGVFFFGEQITVGKVIGGVLTVAGVVLYALSEDDTKTGKPVASESPKNSAGPAKSTIPVNDKITPNTNESDGMGREDV